MRKDAASVASIEGRAQEIPQRLWTLLENVPDRTLHGGRVVIDLEQLYEGTAKLEELPRYLEQAQALAGEGNEVVLTGRAPVWLYLSIAHVLHGHAARLLYASPVTGEVEIFDHRVE
jgi:hypothetical protein